MTAVQKQHLETMFITQARDNITGLINARAKNDYDTIGFLAHKLVGQSRILGQKKMANCSETIERDAKGRLQI